LSAILTAVPSADAVTYSTVTKYLRQTPFTSIFVEPTEEPATITIDQSIPNALEHYPFSSIRGLYCLTCMPTTTVHRHFTQSLGFVVKHYRWVPHTRTLTQKQSGHSLI
jgi:hypothetical protein